MPLSVKTERVVRLAFLLFLLGMATGCTGLEYLPQAAAGQRDLAMRARDIDELVDGGHVDARLRRLLSQVKTIKAFGESHGLSPTANYTKYVKVDRPAMVWVVSASSPLAFASKSWSFPFVGSFTYLGWFKREEADGFAAKLAKEGLDVDVRGAGAYSTAGFFEDPIASTMIAPGKLGLGELADTVLHEMTHATIFVRHQSTLNESVAMFVGRGLAEEYMDQTMGPGSDESRAYQLFEQRGEERGQKMKAAYDALVALYASPAPDTVKLARKAEILGTLHDEIHFKRPINNATLIQYRTYHSGLDELAELLTTCNRDWPRFLRAVKSLESAHLPSTQQPEVGKFIRPLIDAGCKVKG